MEVIDANTVSLYTVSVLFTGTTTAYTAFEAID
jgi:hypothetical protein